MRGIASLPCVLIPPNTHLGHVLETGHGLDDTEGGCPLLGGATFWPLHWGHMDGILQRMVLIISDPNSPFARPTAGPP